MNFALTIRAALCFPCFGKTKIQNFSFTLLLVCSLASVATAQPADDTALSTSQMVEQLDGLAIDNPGSIVEQLREDEQRKDSLFQTPRVDRVLQPWNKRRIILDEKYGLRPQFSFTNLTQWANKTLPFATENNASGYELIVDGTWTFRGRGTDSPAMFGFEFLTRDRMGTKIPPVALFTQTGALYPTTVAFGKLDPSVGQLWLQSIYNNRFGFRVGKLFPISAYDFFPLKNFRTDFIDPIHAANLAIPLPDRGLGGFVMFRPQPSSYLRLGLHDANADAESSGFRSLFGKGELFKIFEVGFDPGFMQRQPGRPPFGDVHLSIWHQDKREEANVEEGWGLVVSGSQRFGRFLPFLRYGYTNSGSGGPAILKHMVNIGLGIDNIFGQSDDRIGIGFTWSEPADISLKHQKSFDMFYRIHVTNEIAVSPTLQYIIDPARNPIDDEILVGGIRTRVEF